MAIIWVGTGRFGVALDPDAAAYITAVETADGQALETAVRDAINAFVIGCKADGIWSAIKASCIMAGARTLAGALVPLVGPAPTNFNFVSGDYNRKTGLVGDGSTKYLNSNRASTADPQNNFHMAAYSSSAGAVERIIIGTGITTSEAGVSNIYRANDGPMRFRSRSNATNPAGSNADLGLIGLSRSSSASFTGRVGGASTVLTRNSSAPYAAPTFIFSGVDGARASGDRLAYYSIGESLDLALLDARVTALINTFGAVIP